MAKVFQQSVPPSLLDALGTILSIPWETGSTGGVTGLVPSARSAQKPRKSAPILRTIKQAAVWLANGWPELRALQPEGEFQRDRRLDTANLIFPPQFWHELTPIEDVTDYGEPTIGVFAGNLNPNWYDQTRLPSVCTFGRASRTYPTPAAGAGLPNPAPGWEGRVLSGVWRDLWFAQRRLTYALPVITAKPTGKAEDRPIIIVAEGTVTAHADFRGYKPWFSFCTWPYLYHDSAGPPSDADFLLTGWNREYLPRLIVPPEVASDWQGTATVRTLRSGSRKTYFGDRLICNRLLLRVTTPPSRGLYFMRNDAVRVSHDVSIRVFMAKDQYG